MRIVVTGGLGHIGSHLIRRLPEEFPGGECVTVDNLSSGRNCSLFSLPSGGFYRFHELDVANDPLEPVFSGADAVVHLAAITDAATSHERPDEVRRTNVLGTEKVAAACLQLGIPLAFVSTTSVYGPQGAAVDEDCPIDEIRPQSVYAESKLEAEKRLSEMSRESELRHVVLRFGTIFGTSPGMRFHTAVNKFCWQAACGERIRVWRTAFDQQRPYLGVDDAVRALFHAIRSRLFDGRIYNVVSAHATVAEVLAEIRRFAPDLSVEEVDHPIMNQLSYVVGCDRFLATGFLFRDRLADGIAATMDLLSGMRDTRSSLTL